MKDPVPARVVLSDANVLYSRVLRDYLLYAATRQLISIAWSQSILDEMTEHLQANIDGFTPDSGALLVRLMNTHFPYALTQVVDETLERVAGAELPDEGDRHVLAAAVESGADVLCTSNLKDFPETIVDQYGFVVQHPDELLVGLIRSCPTEMLAVHRVSVTRLPGATDSSTVAALRRAGAPQAADAMVALLDADQV